MAKKITKDMKIGEVIRANPEAATVLFEAGLMCVGCPMSAQETVEQGLMAHGMEKEKVDEIIKEINK